MMKCFAAVFVASIEIWGFRHAVTENIGLTTYRSNRPQTYFFKEKQVRMFIDGWNFPLKSFLAMNDIIYIKYKNVLTDMCYFRSKILTKMIKKIQKKYFALSLLSLFCFLSFPFMYINNPK